MPTYAVSYIFEGRVSGGIFRCPTFSKNLFSEKEAQGIPCAYLVKEEDGEVGLIASHKYDELVEAYEQQVSNSK